MLGSALNSKVDFGDLKLGDTMLCSAAPSKSQYIQCFARLSLQNRSDFEKRARLSLAKHSKYYTLLD